MAPAATLEVAAAAATALPIVAASERRFAPLRTVWRAKDRLRRRGGGGRGERGKAADVPRLSFFQAARPSIVMSAQCGV